MIGKLLRRYVLPVLVVSIFYFGLLVYPVLRIWHLLLPPPGTVALLVIMVMPLLLRMAAELFPGYVGRALSSAALTWLGICFIAFTVVLGWELVHLLIPLSDALWGMLLCVIIGVISAYAAWNAQRLISVEINIPLPEDAPADAAGLRLAQISDVHIGSRQPGFLKRVVRAVNAGQPDHVLITGDLIDFRNIPETQLASLATLEAPATFIIGNHERYVDVEEICQRLRNLSITVLRNDSVLVGQSLQLIGIDDADARDQVAKHIPAITPEPDRFRILLYHRPDGAEDAAAWGAHLMLCGHTHNGQILPFNMLVRRVFPRILGRYQIGNMILYVSPGTGTWGPVLRLGSRCEVGILHLTHGA